MVWTVRIGGQDAIVLTVSDAFLHMLLARVRDAEVMRRSITARSCAGMPRSSASRPNYARR